jgi:hypothetical protein
MVEHGGNFVLNFANRTLYEGTEATGKYNQIDMVRGVVDFHTHPRQCLNDNTCAVGIPSPADINNIMLGAIYGTMGHLVYSREGTYLIQISPRLLEAIQCDATRLDQANAAMERASDDLHAEFLKRRFPYKSYIQRWLSLMRRMGLKVRLFKLNTVPRFRVSFDCALGDQTHYAPAIHVPTNLASDMQKRCKLR